MRVLTKFTPILMACLILSGIGQITHAQSRTATMLLTNSTNATLVLEFVRDFDRGDFRVVQLEPGGFEEADVPAGIVTLTVRAPRSAADFRFSRTDTLSTGSTYEIVFTPQTFGLQQLANDLTTGGPDSTTAIYDACINADENNPVWFFYNPHNTLSRGTYFQSGNYLCGEDGTAAYSAGGTLLYYACIASFRECEREEISDAQLGDDVRHGNEAYNGAVRPAERRNVIWINSDFVDWQVIIYR